jgi:hypothetical protein
MIETRLREIQVQKEEFEKAESEKAEKEKAEREVAQQGAEPSAVVQPSGEDQVPMLYNFLRTVCMDK